MFFFSNVTACFLVKPFAVPNLGQRHCVYESNITEKAQIKLAAIVIEMNIMLNMKTE